MNTQGSKATLVIQRAVENYVLILELIKLPVKSEVGGGNKILILNLKQLFIRNIFDNHILIFNFNFSNFRRNRFIYRRLLSFLSFPRFEIKFQPYVICPLGSFFSVYVEQKVCEEASLSC